MKRFICVVITFAMMFVFVACNSDEYNIESSVTTADVLESSATTAAQSLINSEATNKCDFYAGYARADITPTKFPVYLAIISIFSVAAVGKELTCQCKKCGFNSWVRKIS